METIRFMNSQGLSVELGNEGPFILTKIEGTGATTADIQTQKSPFQDGTTYLDNVLEPRALSIEVMVIAENEEEMRKRRRMLLQAFNPKLGPGKLIYELGNSIKQIEVMSELAPVFPHAGDFADTMQPGLLQLYCPDPFWLDEYKTSNEIVTWIGGMTFPWILPSSFATKGPKKINIYNEGDAETPIKIEFKGPATNPRIINNTTGEYIQVNRVLSHDDVLIVTTEFGNKRVEINGENVLHWIDLNSTFWQLRPGDNIVEYTSDDEVEPAAVEISYRNRYVGV